jgi:electron transfer flavoprotein alpha subunit
MNNVLVFCEKSNDSIARVSLELISKARELADILKVKVEALIIGDTSVKSMAKEAIAYGADIIYTHTDDRLKEYLTLPYTNIIVQLVKKKKPQIMLIGASVNGRDLAPRVASTLKCGLTADCTSLVVGDYETNKENYKDLLYQIRPAFGGNIIATIVNPQTKPQMATVREGVMKLDEPDSKRKGKVEELNYEVSDKDFIVSILDKHTKEKSVNLTSEQIIVGGGYGVGSKDGFKLIKELADTIGGVVGASRAAVDAGWISKDHQIGQTGVTVRPKLYIMCGISGAVQHTAGMSDSKLIIAINHDPDAPIHQLAHYSIIGDLFDVIPMMIKSYKKHLK